MHVTCSAKVHDVITSWYLSWLLNTTDIYFPVMRAFFFMNHAYIEKLQDIFAISFLGSADQALEWDMSERVTLRIIHLYSTWLVHPISVVHWEIPVPSALPEIRIINTSDTVSLIVADIVRRHSSLPYAAVIAATGLCTNSEENKIFLIERICNNAARLFNHRWFNLCLPKSDVVIFHGSLAVLQMVIVHHMTSISPLLRNHILDVIAIVCTYVAELMGSDTFVTSFADTNIAVPSCQNLMNSLFETLLTAAVRINLEWPLLAEQWVSIRRVIRQFLEWGEMFEEWDRLLLLLSKQIVKLSVEPTSKKYVRNMTNVKKVVRYEIVIESSKPLTDATKAKMVTISKLAHARMSKVGMVGRGMGGERHHKTRLLIVIRRFLF